MTAIQRGYIHDARSDLRYVDNKAERNGATPRLLGRLNVARFMLFGGLYAIAFHFGTR